ncbi:MAG: gamma-glutamylcyclotransferase family protein [Sporomusaceae bacterium]|nr:gamma-glutamylcyclotransferase family protein [Sporomusaceae bacterium]
MKAKVYAAYGSNMNIQQMKRRCPNAQVIGTGELTGYTLTFRGKQNGVANVERQSEGVVPVVLWHITQDCEKALDRYEGYPRLYEKKNVTVGTKIGEQEAMLYVMAEEYEAMPALPHERYLEMIRQGYRDHDLNTMVLEQAVENAKAKVDSL